jgi:hypothetical protein
MNMAASSFRGLLLRRLHSPSAKPVAVALSDAGADASGQVDTEAGEAEDLEDMLAECTNLSRAVARRSTGPAASQEFTLLRVTAVVGWTSR